MIFVTDELVAALRSSRHDDADVRARLATSDPVKHRPLLAAVRAESEERFWASLREVFLNGGWNDASAFPLFAAADFRTHGALEHALDHFAAEDFGVLKGARDRGALVALDLVRAAELGDAEAAERVAQKLDPARLPRWSLGSSPAGAMRVYDILRTAFRGDVRAELAYLVESIGHGQLPAYGARSLAVRLGAPIEELVSLTGLRCGSVGRALLHVAHLVDPALARELVPKLVANAWLKDDPTLVAGLPWEDERTVASAAESFVARRIDALTVTSISKRKGPSKPRWTTKTHRSALEAGAHLEAKLTEASLKQGAAIERWPTASGLASPVKKLEEAARLGQRGVAIELIAAGVSATELVGGWAAVHQAVRGDAEILRRILATGVDPSTPTSDGTTALDVCTSFAGETLRSAELLVAAGGRAHARSVVDYCARNGAVGLVPILARAGVDLRSPLPSGRTPVEVAEGEERWRTAAAFAH